MASQAYSTIADLAFEVLSCDRSASQLARNMFHNRASISEAFDYFAVLFPTSLLAILQSSVPPSPDSLLACSLPLDIISSSTWIVYLHFMEKDGELFINVYCGSGTADSGAITRIKQYESYFAGRANGAQIPTCIKDLVAEGYVLKGTSCLAASTICSDAADFNFERALILLLESTFTTKLWFFKSATFGSVTPLSLWPQATIPYRGLCGTSAVREIAPPKVFDVLSVKDESTYKEREQDRKERQKVYSAKQRSVTFYCENCPKGFKTVYKSNMIYHKTICGLPRKSRGRRRTMKQIALDKAAAEDRAEADRVELASASHAALSDDEWIGD